MYVCTVCIHIHPPTSLPLLDTYAILVELKQTSDWSVFASLIFSQHTARITNPFQGQIMSLLHSEHHAFPCQSLKSKSAGGLESLLSPDSVVSSDLLLLTHLPHSTPTSLLFPSMPGATPFKAFTFCVLCLGSPAPCYHMANSHLLQIFAQTSFQ